MWTLAAVRPLPLAVDALYWVALYWVLVASLVGGGEEF